MKPLSKHTVYILSCVFVYRAEDVQFSPTFDSISPADRLGFEPALHFFPSVSGAAEWTDDHKLNCLLHHRLIEGLIIREAPLCSGGNGFPLTKINVVSYNIDVHVSYTAFPHGGLVVDEFSKSAAGSKKKMELEGKQNTSLQWDVAMWCNMLQSGPAAFVFATHTLSPPPIDCCQFLAPVLTCREEGRCFTQKEGRVKKNLCCTFKTFLRY